MKEIILMRHSKSSWKDKDLQDFERPLNKRGKKNAPKMGKVLKHNGIFPGRIFSSSAKRTRLTAQAVAKVLDFKEDVIYMDELYMAEPEVYMQILQNQPDEFESIMFVGHNPGIEWFLQMLCGEVVSLPTSAIAQISVPIDHWSDLNEEVEAELVNRWKPLKDTEEQ